MKKPIGNGQTEKKTSGNKEDLSDMKTLINNGLNIPQAPVRKRKKTFRFFVGNGINSSTKEGYLNEKSKYLT